MTDEQRRYLIQGLAAKICESLIWIVLILAVAYFATPKIRGAEPLRMRPYDDRPMSDTTLTLPLKTPEPVTLIDSQPSPWPPYGVAPTVAPGNSGTYPLIRYGTTCPGGQCPAPRPTSRRPK